MRVLGVDPSVRATGYGVVESNGAGLKLIEGGVIAPRTSAPFHERLVELVRGLNEVIAGCRPDVMVVEEVFSRPAYPRTALMMAHARGALVCAAAIASLPVHDYAATAVKRALVGRGAASKDQVARMVAQLLGLRRAPSPADVTDALALAIAHCQRSRRAINARIGIGRATNVADRASRDGTNAADRASRDGTNAADRASRGPKDSRLP